MLVRMSVGGHWVRQRAQAMASRIPSRLEVTDGPHTTDHALALGRDRVAARILVMFSLPGLLALVLARLYPLGGAFRGFVAARPIFLTRVWRCFAMREGWFENPRSQRTKPSCKMPATLAFDPPQTAACASTSSP